MKLLQRYQDGDRMRHWLVALLFFMAAFSGLAFFHPALYFFTALFGGGAWARILHPFFGLAMALIFAGLFFKLRHENRMTDADRAWRARAGQLLRGDKGAMPPVGKYNAGQKMVFWLLSSCLLLLFITGFMFWQPWFANAFPILLRRIGVLVHAASAVGLILGVIVHVYAAIWVKGTLRAMTRGTVTEAWARQNHALWYQDMTRLRK
ncbi:MAG: formate dehydrogenase subunit gamma [Paucibacter sp.]|nr:formate dehydrogenase subunit gamma [Roseateles sp.]